MPETNHDHMLTHIRDIASRNESNQNLQLIARRCEDEDFFVTLVTFITDLMGECGTAYSMLLIGSEIAYARKAAQELMKDRANEKKKAH